MRALDDIIVLDLSRVLAGPWATQTLADLGARVIKVEKPGAGDDTRGWGPPFLTDPETGERDDAAYYLCANRGKDSITVDMSTPEGQDIIRRLAEKADVLVENYKVGGLKKYGLDYPSLKEINPKLVYCSITGFGQDGPYAPRAGYDFMIQAMAGMMSVTGERDDLPGGGPQKAGVAVADLGAGLYAAVAILGALHQRGRTSKGQHIDISLLDAQVFNMANQALSYLVSGTAPKRLGNGHATVVPYQSFPTRTGHMIIAVGNDNQFRKLVTVLGRPEMADDPRFRTNGDRVENRDALIPMLEEMTRERPSGELYELLESSSIPCGPINTLEDVFQDPQVIARGLRKDLPHGKHGTVPGVASPLRLSDSPVSYDKAPPLLGENTDEVLADLLGLGETKLGDLHDKEII
ncbi:CaiB/BaiF CoA transferase family protein [Emcibacter nanhaiensis]|uniref:CoA transferase n=1 Tax=Emcibacter nanhaiensis TaxID=1505037 RepID=A0A501PCX7_9PROT|nr:CaiB/BaiF CoA-transferase family protein [Emcibacter nanhaiensis]TPD57857.1 CoA transferase [Emcibacter nanhaiensis]